MVYSSQVEKAHNADLHCVDWNPHDDNLILTGYISIPSSFQFCTLFLASNSDALGVWWCFMFCTTCYLFSFVDLSGLQIILYVCLIEEIWLLMELDHPFTSLRVIKLLFYACRCQTWSFNILNSYFFQMWF